PVTYDLALEKRLLPDQSYGQGSVVRYEVEVTNEGNVPSATFSVADVLPTGMSFDSGSHGATATGSVVTSPDLASLDPGDSVILAVDARLDDVTQASYVNLAQVTVDSADEYSTEDEDVTDVDSVPGEINGEDDEDRA